MGSKWLPVSEELSIRAKLLEQGGPQMWAEFMDELRHEHLDAPKPSGPGIREQLQAAYLEVMERKGLAA